MSSSITNLSDLNKEKLIAHVPSERRGTAGILDLGKREESKSIMGANPSERTLFDHPN